jgi:hypothetical protein
VDTVEVGWNGVVIANAARVDRLRFDVTYGLTSWCYHSIPSSPLAPARALIVHHGHSSILGGFGIPESTAYYVGRGFHVFNLAMPLLSPNVGTTVQTQNGPVVIGSSHNDFTALLGAGEKTNPLRCFMEPVIRLVTHIRQTMGLVTVPMCGLSGGGWTTHMAPLYDRRINPIYGVAGFQPLDVYPATDYEQGAGNLTGIEYIICPIRTMFALASLGRRHIQILNWKDQYYPYVGHEAAVDSYVANVQDQLEGNTLGHFELRVDTTTADQEHVMSADSRVFIANDILAVT